VTKNENPANVVECKPIEICWYLLKAEVSKGYLGCSKLKTTRKKIRACVKKSYPDPLVMLFEGTQSKNRDVGRIGTIEAK
jgi:hypothetical protein